MSGKRLPKPGKGEMARRLVYFCIIVLTVTLIWTACLYTYATIHSISIDLSPVLTFVAAAFGGELLLLCVKRIFAKSTDETTEEV